MSEWEPINFSRSETTTWQFECGDGLRVVITCGHIDYPGKWVMHCDRLGICTKLMPATNREQAESDALGYVRSTLLGLVQAFEDATETREDT